MDEHGRIAFDDLLAADTPLSSSESDEDAPRTEPLYTIKSTVSEDSVVSQHEPYTITDKDEKRRHDFAE